MTRIAFDSLGCKLNQAETEFLARQCAEAGYSLVSPDEEADIYVLNTCTVTHIADRKSRHLLRLAHRRSPGARLVAIGCYAERASEELSSLDGVSLVLGNSEKPQLLSRLREAGYPGRTACVGAADRGHNGCRTRAFLKVQDGCRNFCTYCVVPLVRREEMSVPADQIVGEVRQRIEGGYKEVVLTGTEVGAYGCDGLDLAGLLGRILAETAVVRLRLSSLQPQEVSLGLVRLWRDRRLCPHFHLSLQSGSDGVLRRMKRRYSAADYQRAVDLIRESVTEVAITTDIIVGFPGETEAEFEESYSFCRRMGFARIHVFPYSPRQGTEAARMPQMVVPEVKKQRSREMLALAGESARGFNGKFLGKTVPVLWEKQSGGGWSGLTDNYVRVYARSTHDLTNELAQVKLVALSRDGVRGEVQ